MIDGRRLCNAGLAVLCLAAVWTVWRGAFLGAVSAGGAEERETARSGIVFSHPLPRLDGDHLTATLVQVSYEPGESSPPHSHPCPVIGYVTEGEIRTQVKGQPEETYRAGESFYEPPNGIHLISANASDKETAKFIAYFVCDRETPLSVPVPQNKAEGGR